jgi:hypothetical protein
VLINGFGVYHFTAVRPTMYEIVQKHRESGHYDDTENYDFEGWIKNVLPTLGLGTKRAHMYRKDNIWPGTRPWTKAELAFVPEDMLKWCDTASATDQAPPSGPTGNVSTPQAPAAFRTPPVEMKSAPKATPFPIGRAPTTNLYRKV